MHHSVVRNSHRLSKKVIHSCLWLVLPFALCHHAIGQVYVDIAATGANDGTSWADAYTDLQVALASTASGEIWVAAGVYHPTTCSPCLDADRSIAFDLKDNVAVYGGFDGTESNISQRDFNANLTILSGDIGTAMDSTDNSYHVCRAVHVNSSCILDGVIVEQGNADNSSVSTDNIFGGGNICRRAHQ